jgi:hypothetical protein
MEEFMHAPIAIEVAPFTIADGIDEAQLVEASEMLEREFLSRQPGYLPPVLRLHGQRGRRRRGPRRDALSGRSRIRRDGAGRVTSTRT